jgi:uncharacterized protein DUF4238
MEYKNQHWIPISYLSAWCDPNTPEGQTPYVWIFSKDGKTSQRKAPKNIFFESEMYTIYRSDGSRDLKLEQALNHLETCFAWIKRDKFSCKLVLSETEKFLLYHFVATMRARTVAQRDHQKKHWGEVLQMMDSLAEQWLGSSKTPSKPISNSPKTTANKRSISHEQVRELANQPLQQTIAPMVRAQVTNYMSMSMAIICTKTKPGFISSDAPLVWYDPCSTKRSFPYNSPGLIYDTIEVTLPISPQQLLFISWNDNLEGYIDIDDEIQIDRLNLRTCLFCKEYFVVNENIKKDFWLGRRACSDDNPR